MGAGPLLFGALASQSRKPSSHSTSSRYSRKVRPERPRVNQPTGYRGAGDRMPVRMRGKRHDYIFYPVDWIDEVTGRSYEKGYYDEEGTRYEDVSFAKDGRYENVVCKCTYCGREAMLSLSTESADTKTFTCPACGAPLEIQSALDEYDDTAPEVTYRGTPSDGYSESSPRRSRKPLLLIGLAALAVLYLLGSMRSGTETPKPEHWEDTAEVYSISLSRTAPGIYEYTEGRGDKTLVWDESAESYYDEASDCWVWYNEDLDPAVWQYWYEGISSNYGDYGWMEHYSDGWFIEASDQNWVPLPDRYISDRLWYIE